MHGASPVLTFQTNFRWRRSLLLWQSNHHSCLLSEVRTTWYASLLWSGPPQTPKNLPDNAGDTGDLGSIPGLEEMATHPSILAWEVPWTEEPGGLQSMGSQRVRHDWSYLAQHKYPVTIAASVGCLCGDPSKLGKWAPGGYKHELPDLTGGPFFVHA